MLFMPLVIQARRGLLWAVGLLAVCAAASMLSPRFAFGEFFVAGAYLSRFELRSRLLESPIPTRGPPLKGCRRFRERPWPAE